MRKFFLILATVSTLLLGCDANTSVSTASEASAPVKQGKTVSAELVGYNHTDKTIGAFYVNGQWGGNITPGSGGGKFVCCVELPEKWVPGYSVLVAWEDHEGRMNKREILVPEYDAKTLSDFNVHFLRSGEIKVFALLMGLRHRDYPLQGAEAELKSGVPIEKVY